MIKIKIVLSPRTTDALMALMIPNPTVREVNGTGIV